MAFRLIVKTQLRHFSADQILACYMLTSDGEHSQDLRLPAQRKHVLLAPSC